MAKVYIPQVTERYDHGLMRPIPTIDWTPATKFGALHEVLDRGDNPAFLQSLRGKISERLKNFKPEQDFLIAAGDPAIIAVCSSHLSKTVGTFKLLKWDRKLECYLVVEIS